MEWNDYLAQIDRAYEELTGPALEGRLEELGQACLAEYGGESPVYGAMLNELGALYKGAGKLEQSEGYFLQALALMEGRLGRESQAYATVLNDLAGVHRLQGRLAEAEEEFKACLKHYEAVLGRNHVLYAAGLNNLSLVYLDQDRLAQAAELQKQAADILRALPECRDELAVSLCNLGVLRQRLGQLEEAEELLLEALRMFREELGTDTPHYHASLNALGVVRYASGRYDQAKADFSAAAEAAQRLYGPDHWEVQAAREHARLAGQAAEEGQ